MTLLLLMFCVNIVEWFTNIKINPGVFFFNPNEVQRLRIQKVNMSCIDLRNIELNTSSKLSFRYKIKSLKCTKFFTQAK